MSELRETPYRVFVSFLLIFRKNFLSDQRKIYIYIYLILSINSIICTREIRTIEMRYILNRTYDDFSCREMLDNRSVEQNV